MKPIAQSLDVPSAPCNCGIDNFQDNNPLYISAFGGASYFNTEPQTSFGGMYGLSMSRELHDRLSVMSTGMVNHYSGGTQFAGSIGGFVSPRYYGEAYERIGGGIFFDQFHDTHLDTYTALTRYALRYKLLPGVSAGMQYTDPLIGDSVKTIIPGGGVAGTPIRPVQVIQAQAFIYGTTLGVGYVDQENSMTYSFNQIRPLSERLSSQLSVTYDENVGLWSGFMGMQFDLTPRAKNWLTAQSSTRGFRRDIVRGDAGSSIASMLFAGDVSYDSVGIDPFTGRDKADDERKKQQDQTNQELANEAMRQLNETLERLQRENAACLPGEILIHSTGNVCYCKDVKTNALRQIACP